MESRQSTATRPRFGFPPIALAAFCFTISWMVPRPATSEPFFAAPFLSFDAGTWAWGVATADLNGDGHLDIAVANRKDNTVSVLIGDGSGSFGPKVDYPTGGGPLAVLIADLNSDGVMDMLTSNTSDNAVSILLGLGDGSFGTPRRSPIAGGGGAMDTRMIDFNNDGRLDVAAASIGGTGGISVALGNGDGSFAPARLVRAGGRPTTLATGDVNGDGKPDIVMFDQTLPGSIWILLGTGNGEFAPGILTVPNVFVTSLALVDLNGDSRLDMLALSFFDSSMLVFIGRGDATFGSPTTFAGGQNAGATFAIGDVNGDSWVDLIVPSNGSSGVNVVPGRGDGTFGPFSAFPTDWQPQTAGIGDFNGDGRIDIATANFIHGTVSVLLRNENGTYGADTQIEVGEAPIGIALEDLNGDGKSDVQTANYRSASVSVLLNAGRGAFGARHDYAVGAAPAALATGNLDGDSHLDLVVPNYDWNTISVLHGLGDGGFAQRTDFSVPPSPTAVAIADLNGDGSQDITVGSGDGIFACLYEIPTARPSARRSSALDQGAIATVLGSKDGTLSPGSTTTLGRFPSGVACGDLNGDRIADLATTDPKLNKVFVAVGQGDGSFGSPAEVASLLYAQAVAIEDLDHDGRYDLIIGRSDPCGVGGGGIALLLNQGDGTFQENQSFSTPGGSYAFAVGDLDGDGRADIATANTSNSVSVFFGSGDGTFQPKLSFGTGKTPLALAIGDLDGDGRMDLAAANAWGNTVSLLFNVGGVPTVRPARAFLTGGDRTIPIGAGPPRLYVNIEPIDGSFEVSELDLSTVSMTSEGTGTVDRIPAALGRRLIAVDSDGNGAVEIAAGFDRADLGKLFGNIHGKRTVSVAIDGGLVGGGSIHAALALRVVRTGPQIHSKVTPNPSPSVGELTVTTEAAGPVKVTIFDASGRLIRVVADLSMEPPGEHTFRLAALAGRARLASGIYFYRVETPGLNQTGKFVVAK